MESNTENDVKGILRVAIKDKAHLYHSYIPFFLNGGLFVQTHKEYVLGEEVFILLMLPETTERIPVGGQVAWLSPAKAEGNRPAGIGIQFGNEEGKELRKRIEAMLVGIMDSGRPTFTL